MAQNSISNPFGTVYPEHYTCENCVSWRGDWHNKTYATINDPTVWVGQCGSTDDAAPYADLDQGIAVVYPPAAGAAMRLSFTRK